MKKILLIIALTVASFTAFAQDSEEEVAPTLDNVTIVRRCSVIDIEGDLIDSVTVTIKNYAPDYVFKSENTVRVTIERKGKTIYKKKFKPANLYIFSSGEIQIGKPRFTQVLIIPYLKESLGKIRAEEGIYF